MVIQFNTKHKLICYIFMVPHETCQWAEVGREDKLQYGF